MNPQSGLELDTRPAHAHAHDHTHASSHSTPAGPIICSAPDTALDDDAEDFEADALGSPAQALSAGYVVWTARPDGSPADMALWQNFTGLSLAAIRRDGWLGAVIPDERPCAWRIWSDALASATPFELECRVRRASGRYRRLLVRGVPMPHPDGGVREWVLTGAGTDAAERTAAYLAMDKEREASQTHAHELEAILEGMADGVLVFDSEGRLLRENSAANALLGAHARTRGLPRTSQELAAALILRDAQGQPLPDERRPLVRALRGETLRGADATDVMVRALDGRDVLLSESAAPMRDAGGHIVGAVLILRDVTKRQRLAQRTHEALTALVAMAEMLVSTGAAPAEAAHAPSDSAPRSPLASPSKSAGTVAWRLADLTRMVTGCRQVATVEIEPEDDDRVGIRPVAVVGPTTQREVRWLAQLPRGRLSEILEPELLTRLERGESVPVDHAQLQFARVPNPSGTRFELLTPMRLGGRLVGLLLLDYGMEVHTLTPDELELAAGAARLAALVLERERLLREREEARANELALREANRRMDEFLAIATHELRAPVMASLMGVELAVHRVRRLRDQQPALEAPLAGQLDAISHLLGQAEESVERLSRLVSDLLDVSRIRGDQLVIRPAPHDLAVIVREVVAKQRQLAHGRVIRLHLPDSMPVPVFVDADRIGQVITNYLSNALKFSPEDCPVRVRVQIQGSRARVSVRDEGPGLSAEQQRRIWDRYHQVPEICANAAAGTGLGLGLYIGRTIIEKHGGKIGVRSTPGKGSTFWFTLPLASAAT